MRQFRRTHLAAFFLIAGIYIAARLWGLTASCLWFDEIFSVHAAEHDWGSLWSFVALDLIHPPLFYALLKLWIGVGGDGLLWLRLLPVLFAVIAIFPFLSLCIELKISFWTRLFALGLLAVNGSLIKYSQEVRMYSLLMCLSLFSMWLFARYLQRGKSMTALVIVNVLLIWTHYFGWFVVVSEIAAILIFQRIKWRPILSMFAVAAVSFVPWGIAVLLAARDGSGLSQNIGWMLRPGISAIVQFKFALVEPFYFQASNVDPMSIYWISIPLMLIISAAIVVYLFGWKRLDTEEKRVVGLIAIFAVLPAITAFVASRILPYSVWGTRHLIIVFAPVSLIIALVLSNLPVYKLRLAAIALVILFGGYACILRASRPDPEYIWCAWEQLIDKLDPGTEAHIYAAEDVIAYHLWFAARHTPRVQVSKLEIGAPEDTAYFLPRGFTEVNRVGLDGLKDNEFWLAFRNNIDTTPMQLPDGLDQRGYVIEKAFEVDLQNTRAFLVKVSQKVVPISASTSHRLLYPQE